ncbi:MAG: hypothetical protein BGN82_07135 [Alphaproteobacteria bacterium 65-7]|nr:MAG: hypothetical protein BGN82_07135 [Alphaproteobacteria bacterium 65-7]
MQYRLAAPIPLGRISSGSRKERGPLSWAALFAFADHRIFLAGASPLIPSFEECSVAHSARQPFYRQGARFIRTGLLHFRIADTGRTLKK